MQMAQPNATPSKVPISWGGILAFLNSALVIALVVAAVGYFSERSKNTQATLQAQQLAVRAQDLTRINTFQDSGVAVDQAFVEFETALKKGAGREKARENFLAKARLHASQSNELRSLIGDTPTDDHLKALKALQDTIRNQQDFSSYGDVRTALSSFLTTREMAVERAKHRPLDSIART
jgi:hypothetical protein